MQSQHDRWLALGRAWREFRLSTRLTALAAAVPGLIGKFKDCVESQWRCNKKIEFGYQLDGIGETKHAFTGNLSRGLIHCHHIPLVRR